MVFVIKSSIHHLHHVVTLKMLDFLSSQWEEIGNGVWMNPIRLRVTQKDAKSKTAFAGMVLMFSTRERS